MFFKIYTYTLPWTLLLTSTKCYSVTISYSADSPSDNVNTNPFYTLPGTTCPPMLILNVLYSKLFLNIFISNFTLKLIWSYYQLTSFKCKPPFQVDFHCRGCLAQIRFVINVPKQVTKPKGYVAALNTLILLIRSWKDRDLF